METRKKDRSFENNNNNNNNEARCVLSLSLSSRGRREKVQRNVPDLSHNNIHESIYVQYGTIPYR
eukprot:scaffold24364_cov176-Amphora_coffeaeformis.AAC.1